MSCFWIDLSNCPRWRSKIWTVVSPIVEMCKISKIWKRTTKIYCATIVCFIIRKCAIIYVLISTIFIFDVNITKHKNSTTCKSCWVWIESSILNSYIMSFTQTRWDRDSPSSVSHILLVWFISSVSWILKKFRTCNRYIRTRFNDNCSFR